MNIYHGFCFGIDESKSDEISTPQSNQNEVFEKVDTWKDENFEDLVKVKIQLQQNPFVYSDVESLDDNMKREGPSEIDYSEVDIGKNSQYFEQFLQSCKHLFHALCHLIKYKLSMIHFFLNSRLILFFKS